MVFTAPVIQLTSIQQDLLARIESYYNAGKNSCLLFLPTGGGKTVVAADLIARWVRKGKRVLFCCHRIKLVDQTVDKLQRFYGIQAAVIQGASRVNKQAPVFVGMLQTLSNRELPPNIDLVIFDEAHSTSYWNTAYNIMLHYSGGIFAISKCKFLGLSGSPWRTKSTQGFCQFYDCLVTGPYLDELAAVGEITPVRHFGWGGLIDYSKLSMGAEDYTQESLEMVCDEALNEKIVTEYRCRYSHHNSVVFCGTVKQATDIHARFNGAGLKAGLIVGTTSSKERDSIYKQYEDGKIKVLVGVSVFTEGFDAPICDTVVLAYPTASRAKLYQMTGRSTRKYAGKIHAYLLDFCDNFSRLGFVTEHHPISLCPVERESLSFESLIKFCPKCNLASSRYARVCECGYIYSKESNIAAEIKSKKRKPDYDSYGEILTTEQRRQIGYLRRKLHKIIDKGADPSLVVRLFFDHYRTIPPIEWFLGAVFDSDTKDSTMRVWHDYLKRVRPFGETWWYEYWMRAEFGNKAVNFDRDDKWFEFFGCGADSSWEEVFDLYRGWITGKSESDVVNANLMLEQAAYQLKQWDYISTFTTNRARVSELQMKMLQLASDVIAAIIESDAAKLKKLINQDLHLWQNSIKYLTDDERGQLRRLLESYNSEKVEDFSYTLHLKEKALVGSWCLLNDNRICLIINVDINSGQYLGAIGNEHITFRLYNIKLVINFGDKVEREDYISEPSITWRLFIVKHAPQVYRSLNELYIFTKFNQDEAELELYVSNIIYKKFIHDLFDNKMLAPLVSVFQNEGKLLFLNIRCFDSHSY
jgi:superfamily II DNA or RNA helicase